MWWVILIWATPVDSLQSRKGQIVVNLSQNVPGLKGSIYHKDVQLDASKEDDSHAQQPVINQNNSRNPGNPKKWAELFGAQEPL